ncbi:MAG: hypothetical protein DMG67_06340 [Acidobacteria bacterium]|nr:MAG: hypothetical protein DMG67_06340 [Acidobacteriota bacterium]
MQQHTVLLTFDERGNVVPLSPDGTRVESNLTAKQGDQIRWITPHGSALIEFQGSTPFGSGTSKRNEDFRTLSVSEGSFPYRCSITTTDGQKHGWQGNCGGTVVVGGSTRSGD